MLYNILVFLAKIFFIEMFIGLVRFCCYAVVRNVWQWGSLFSADETVNVSTMIYTYDFGLLLDVLETVAVGVMLYMGYSIMVVVVSVALMTFLIKMVFRSRQA
jgi:hypothetical protein